MSRTEVFFPYRFFVLRHRAFHLMSTYNKAEKIITIKVNACLKVNIYLSVRFEPKLVNLLEKVYGGVVIERNPTQGEKRVF